MAYSCAIHGGAIDWFQYALTEQEVIEKSRTYILENTQRLDKTPEDFAAELAEELKRSAIQIRNIILKQEQEEPHTIRYFGVPNFQKGNFDLYAVAKTGNEGSTYVFGNDQSIVEALGGCNKDKLLIF